MTDHSKAMHSSPLKSNHPFIPEHWSGYDWDDDDDDDDYDDDDDDNGN